MAVTQNSAFRALAARSLAKSCPMRTCMLPSVVPCSVFRCVAGLAGALLLAGCAIPDAVPGLDKQGFTPNDFDSSSMYVRRMDAAQADTCEAARRALLSQGYLVQAATSEMVTARKFYQPNPDTHYTVEMRVVCAPEGDNGERSSAFASAVQDRYVIKKVNNSASLGVGGLGSVSLPFSATDDTLVKVGSETINDAQFYSRFFQLFERYVRVLPMAEESPLHEVPMQEREALQRNY